MFFSLTLIIAHLQAIIIPIFLSYKSINKFKSINNSSLIPFGFLFLGVAAMFEMFDHINTEWIYINHSSLFNWLFYSFLSTGLTLLSISVIKNKFIIFLKVIICLFSISFYWFIGKEIALIFQVIISIFLIISWHKRFKDWIFLGYPIFGIFLTTFLGITLSVSANQLWHIFIGPSGSISVLTFYFVLIRAKRRF